MEYSKLMSELHSPVHHPGRSGKDLSHRKVLSFKIGELLPILCEEILPGDYFEIDVASMLRTMQPLQTAAFARMKMCYDFFFVPNTAVWSNFNAYYDQRPQYQSSVLQGSAYEPNMKIDDIFHLHLLIKLLQQKKYGFHNLFLLLPCIRLKLVIPL